MEGFYIPSTILLYTSLHYFVLLYIYICTTSLLFSSSSIYCTIRQEEEKRGILREVFFQNIFWTFGDLTSWFWMVFDGLFGSNRQFCSKTVEIAATVVWKHSETSLSDLLSQFLLYYSHGILSHTIFYQGCTVFFLLSTISQQFFNWILCILLAF